MHFYMLVIPTAIFGCLELPGPGNFHVVVKLSKVLYDECHFISVYIVHGISSHAYIYTLMGIVSFPERPSWVNCFYYRNGIQDEFDTSCIEGS